MLTLPATHQQLSMLDVPKQLFRHREAILESVRPAWLLRALEVDILEAGDSFLGGDSPYRADGEAWPICVCCQREMGFVMQIHLSDALVSTIPALPPGLFQFWNCWHCVPSGEARDDARQLVTFNMIDKTFVPYGSSQLLTRWIEGGSSSFGSAHQSEQNLPYLKKLVPEPFLSLPSSPKTPLHSSDWSDDERSIYQNAFHAACNGETITQVGGYPSWVQDDYWPRSSGTAQLTEFVLALGTGDTDVLWGDTGFYYFFADRGNLGEPFVLEQTL